MKTYIYTGCGDSFVSRVNLSLEYLKKYTKQDIIVIYSRSSLNINHDNILYVNIPKKLDNRSGAIFLKTNIHNHINLLDNNKYLYLDSDIIANRNDIDSIFLHDIDSICFSNDHTNLDTFSPCAVKYGHITDHLKKIFDVHISKEYIQPNGGLFLFNKSAELFLSKWYDNCLKILSDPIVWSTRDQGALLATIFQLHMQNNHRINNLYNYIINNTDTSPSIESLEKKLVNPYFIHFIANSFTKHKNLLKTIPAK